MINGRQHINPKDKDASQYIGIEDVDANDMIANQDIHKKRERPININYVAKAEVLKE